MVNETAQVRILVVFFSSSASSFVRMRGNVTKGLFNFCI